MKRLIFASLLASLLANGAGARTLSPDEALSRAFSGTSTAMKAPSASALSLAYTAEQPGNAGPGVYVFGSSTGGFYVVSADDAGIPLLGYSDTGAFSAADMPPAMRWWLESYAAQLSEATDGGNIAFRAPRAARAEIAPLVRTEWNQGAPFNNRCPMVSGKRSVTGCVATALAQIMNYHEYPAAGTGSNSYQLKADNSTVSLDFSTISFDWANMADSYEGSYTQAQANAVAGLMYACGVSVNMQYTPSESGAPTQSVASAMAKYFGYDQAIVFQDRTYYSSSDWEDLVYSQLKEYGPVQYSGRNGSSGHSFVCDGYRADGYFHINWGWGGMSDGYFLLSALDPDRQGIGGSTAGYNSDQGIVANVSRPRPGSTPTILVGCPVAFGFEGMAATAGQWATMTGRFSNLGIADIDGRFGIRMVNNSTGEVFYAEYTQDGVLQSGYGYSKYYVLMPKDLASGTYTVTPGFRPAGTDTWIDALINVNCPQSMLMTVDGSNITFTELKGAELTSSDFALGSELHLGSAFLATATIHNTGSAEFYGYVHPAIIKDSQIIALGEAASLTVAPGASCSLDYAGSLSLFADGELPSPGTYSMCLVVPEGNGYKPISNLTTVNLQAAAAATLELTDLRMVGDANAVNPDAAKVRATVKCTAGYFSGNLTAYVFPAAGGQSLCYDNEMIFIGAGQSKTLEFTLAIPSAQPGSRYQVGIYQGSTSLSNTILFTTGVSTGIEDVEADDDAPVEYYNLQGIRVENPENGIFIRRQGNKTTKVAL